MPVRDKHKKATGVPGERAAREPAGPIGCSAHKPGRRAIRLRPLLAAAPKYLGPAALTQVFTLPLFAPWSVWPLGYVAFAPWLLLVCMAGSAAGVYVTSYLLGAVFFLTHWRWLFETTPPGYFAGCLAFALYFCLAAWLVRHLCRRRRIPVTFAFPVAWVLVEMMRSHGPLAFPWFLLGHSQIRLLGLVQIADITGVCGVSFAVAMVNGLIADLLLRKFRVSRFKFQEAAKESGTRNSKLETRTLFWPAAPVAVVLVTAILSVYGWWRLTTLKIEPGPSAAVLQGDFLLKAEEDPNAPSEAAKQAVYLSLLNEAGGQRPDLIVLPETPWSMYLNKEMRHVHAADLESLSDLQKRIWTWQIRNNREWTAHFLAAASKHQATIVVGAMSQERQPEGSYPSEHRYNSAFVFRPRGGEAERYDKIHLVMFGEFVPFRYSIPPVYWWINGLTPWGQGGHEYSLTPGREYRVFPLPIPGLHAPMDAASDPQTLENVRPAFGITICYEDVIPQVFRRFTLDADGKKRVDFMLNISNDGWFGHGAQQAQHLVNCAFRAIENRVGIARSVNTGVSGFIRPDGSWHHLVAVDPKRPTAGGTGYRIARMESSPAVTFYARFGDVFGAAVALVGCMAAIDAIIARRGERKRAGSTSTGQHNE